jgi:hypothetical protein
LRAIVFVWFSDDCWLAVVILVPILVVILVPIPVVILVPMVVLVVLVPVVIIFVIEILRRHYIADEV